MQHCARHLLLLVALSLGSVSLAQNFQQRESPAPSATRPNELQQVFMTTEGGFTIALPDPPTRDEPRPGGSEKAGTAGRTYSWFTNAGAYYVNYYDSFPGPVGPIDSGQVLDGLQEMILKTVGGKLLAQTAMVLDWYAGRELRVENDKGFYIFRLFPVRQRLYQLTAFFPKSMNVTEAQQAAAARTLDSFRLLPGKAEAAGEVERLLQAWQGQVLVLGRCLDCKPEKKTTVIYPGIRGEVTEGKAVSKPQPEYPPIAKAAHASGTVLVQIIVDEAGKVVAAQAITGHPLLKPAAVSAARQARFTPTLLDGKPVKVAGLITYNFVLI
ncbi:MAG: energy transducer TonB [Pyrinomonadaceae bacterium]